MANLVLGFPLYELPSVSFTPTFSGGSYEATLPLSNVAHRSLHKVARTVDDALTSTIAKVDLGTARSIRMVAAVGHNLSTAAKARVRLLNAVPFVEDPGFAAWTEQGTSVTTSGQTDPFGGTRAYLIGDDDAAGLEGVFREVAFTGDGTKTIAVSARAGSAALSSFGVYDNSAAAFRHLVSITWTGGVPSLSTEDGSGTLFTPIQISSDWWLLQCTVPSVVAANTNRFYLYGAQGSVAAATGTTYYYEAMAFNYDAQPIVEDSGVDDAWPSGLDLEEADGINVPYVHILSSATSARYVRLELADTANADGFVELGRLIVAGGYQPTINMSYGAKLGLESDSIRTVTDGGAAVYQEKAVRRTLRFALEHIEEAEAFASAWQMQRRLGTSGQVFVVWDPSDAVTILHERSFLGVLRQLHGLDAPYPQRYAAAFEIVEEL